MKKSLFALLILCLTINYAFSQEKLDVIEIDYYSKMSKFDFNVEKVIDNRLIKSNIGYARSIYKNQYYTLVFPKEFETYLTKKFTNMIKKCKNCEDLTLIFNEFSFAERNRFKGGTTYLRLHMDIAREIDGQYYSLATFKKIYYFDSYKPESKHSSVFKKAIKKIFSDFEKTDWENFEGELVELKDKEFRGLEKWPKDGCYTSFSDLCENKPYIKESFTLKKANKENVRRFKLSDKHGTEIEKKIEFIVQDSALFLHSSAYSYFRHYIKSDEIGRFIYFEDMFSDTKAGVHVGAIGLAATIKEKPVVLDTETGKVYVLTDKNMVNFLDDYPEIKKLYEKSPKLLDQKKEAIMRINKKYDKVLEY